MASVPTVDSMKDSASTGLSNGAIPGIAALVGNSVVPGGLGTAVGGIAGASALDGPARERMSETAVFVGATQLGNGGSSGGESAGRM